MTRIEGTTAAGVPVGAMSGILQRALPALLARRHATPYEACLVRDCDARYFLTMRLALARRVSAVGTADQRSTVFANACSLAPFALATKKKYSLSAGASVASIEARPGFAIGPGGNPSCAYVLYGLSVSSSCARWRRSQPIGLGGVALRHGSCHAMHAADFCTGTMQP